jgi:formate--tetrahydrofolate ligase
MRNFKIPTVVAINHYHSDAEEELELVKDYCRQTQVPVSICKGFELGSNGTRELAEMVHEAASSKRKFVPTYQWNQDPQTKIEAIAKKVYGARKVAFTQRSLDDLRKVEKLKLQHLPVCMAKTQSSFTDDPKIKGAPEDFTLQVREVEIAAGAGFIIPLTGKMLRMPGLPEKPAAENIDIDRSGNITGLA